MNPYPAAFRESFRPPERLSVSEWCDRHRHLPATDPKPGPWRTDTTPFMREPMDALADPMVEELVVMAGAQVGKSRLLENVIGYVADEDPADMLLVVARDQDCRTVADTRLKPMMQASPHIRRLAANNDPTHESWRFRSCTVFLAASNSPAGLASKSCRVVLLDEIGKWPDTIKKEGSPIDLARQRTNAFAGRRKIVAVSSATTDKHGIAPEYQRGDQREFHVPCPACGHHQVLRWEQVKFEGRDPDQIVAEGLAWYECESCGERWDDATKRRQVAKGVWVPKNGRLLKDGTVEVDRPSIVRSYHVNGLLSPFRPFSDFVARFLKAKKNRAKLGVFFRSDLGIPWQERSDEIDEIDVHKLSGDYRIGDVPEGVELVTIGADVGKRYVHWVARGWSRSMDSWLLDRGAVTSLAQLRDQLRRRFGQHTVRRLFVDSGYQTNDVLTFANKHRGVVWPIKGDTRGTDYWKARQIDRTPGGRVVSRGLRRFDLQVDMFKTELAALQSRDQWRLPQDIDADYLEQIDAEELVIDEKDGRARWQQKTEGAANHYLDAEVYALAAAWTLGIWKGRELPNDAKEEDDQTEEVRRQPQPKPSRQRTRAKGRPAGGLRAKRRGGRKPFGA